MNCDTREVFPTCPSPIMHTRTFLSSSTFSGWGLVRGELRSEDEYGDLKRER